MQKTCCHLQNYFGEKLGNCFGWRRGIVVGSILLWQEAWCCCGGRYGVVVWIMVLGQEAWCCKGWKHGVAVLGSMVLWWCCHGNYGVGLGSTFLCREAWCCGKKHGIVVGILILRWEALCIELWCCGENPVLWFHKAGAGKLCVVVGGIVLWV